MKTIGLIGGMSWESTQHYYQLINTAVKETCGGLHSAKVVLVSVDFAPIEALQRQGNWQAAGELLAQAAKQLEAAGADFVLICTNTMHIVAEQVQQAVSIPLIHIADATGDFITAKGYQRIALLGTAFTMEQPFYKQRLQERYQLDIITPNETQRAEVHRIIYQELCLGKIKPSSQDYYLSVLQELQHTHGAEAAILGCTEIGLLVKQQMCGLPLIDTTEVHALAAVKHALAKSD